MQALPSLRMKVRFTALLWHTPTQVKVLLEKHILMLSFIQGIAALCPLSWLPGILARSWFSCNFFHYSNSSALDQAKAMGHILSRAKDKLYDCDIVARTFRAMVQSTEDKVTAMKKKTAFLIQLAAKTIPKRLQCLPLQLAADYYMQGYYSKQDLDKEKLEDPSLYHYAIFSDNVLATSVVVNSTVLHAKEREKHVFHVVTDKLNFAAMRMWFLVNPPMKATIQVENIDDFKWLNSSYCSVLRQLESARTKEYYFKVNHPTTVSAGEDNLKYRNPKYLSMLNHLRFYLPEVYPKLDKILFLDDDIVVQKDLTPLWSVDLQGMVNGAVETCKESFHRFDKYLNFSNPKISENFDPNACGWAFGMNIFDLKEWKRRNITGIYHRWQDMVRLHLSSSPFPIQTPSPLLKFLSSFNFV